MQIAAYILEIKTQLPGHNAILADTILKNHFCPLFVVHGANVSLAVCEDCFSLDDNGFVNFKNYDIFCKEHMET
ncbi:orf108 [Cryptophlebia peltastica nucleopolyhedrovirus]|uniref:Orf108 n=1 Tax=Cryptophlebia peltastica nucleopolyhedrovirus TaxID=2304025 RepID=A0A346RNX7_9ABAC|nr:orf108 [Cryptophlebia peltastica nucleopolyhedrovirus]AXS67774.1 orf108 [Cryptophlebia peltastica nucleopolyhedrovirus]